MKVNHTRNKLLKNGFIAEHQTDRHDVWIDMQGNGTDISFYHNSDSLEGAIKVHGRRPDEPQFDNFYSSHVTTVKSAIMLSRL